MGKKRKHLFTPAADPLPSHLAPPGHKGSQFIKSVTPEDQVQEWQGELLCP